MSLTTNKNLLIRVNTNVPSTLFVGDMLVQVENLLIQAQDTNKRQHYANHQWQFGTPRVWSPVLSTTDYGGGWPSDVVGLESRGLTIY